jgi:polysaccharide export outer membrane protein
MNVTQQSGAAMPNNNSHGMLGARVALAAMLSACALAPGQHMATPPTLPATTADNGDVTSDMQIPVKQIDLALIREIRADQKNDAKVQSQLNLFAKPAGYKLGSSDVLQITV